MFDLHIQAKGTEGIPELRASFGRTTVLLGANGTGKSKILNSIRATYHKKFGPNRKVIYVEGGRVVIPPNNLHLGPNEINSYTDFESASHQHAAKQDKNLASRVRDALFVLDRKNADTKIKHSDAVHDWRGSGGCGEMPCREEMPLEKFFKLFSEILPDINLQMQTGKNFVALKGPSTYSLSAMSEGEKQVFAIIADIAMLADARSLILIDEPELNLHPSLACDLWTAIENNYPDSVFVYATHSIQFAMRDAVNRVIVISNKHAPIEVPEPASIDPDLLRPFLGSIPAILSVNKALIVEGREASFDQEFYSWLAGNGVKVIPLGNCIDVHNATSQIGVWERIARTVRLIGLIDRDYRSDEAISKLETPTCFALEFNEAESYLCHPDVLSSLSIHLGLKGISREEVLDFLCDRLTKLRLRIAGQRATERTSAPANVSVPRRYIDEVSDEGKLIEFLRKESISEVQRVSRALSPDNVEGIFREELDRCDRAVQERSADSILKLLPGKETLQFLAKRIGCTDAKYLISGARKHLDPDKFICFLNIRKRIAYLSDQAA